MKFSSDRYFTIFDFFISHGQLLIRASKNDNYESNLDIVFMDVKFIQLKTYFNGLSIQKIEKNNSIIPYSSVNKYLAEEQSNLFEIESGNEKFYVAASLLHVYENDLDFNETVLGVIQFKGRDNLVFEIQ